ncbi:capsule biosynthesis protein [Neisseria chenwenguii]|uniref:Capsule biosynthesis protein n=1 Tax=Neisseria chenwenguii TaxID=1853278 RepID=A0A220S2B6_9NEIS|nr:capsule biosynthesis protein [Neisseria chenwenguii]ASK27543.1 capsule biosynthesis protein [Neisseria chenwenguii]ROV55621.1 capsule biosynthesis protein [Neisseria chenwenguii]
MSEQENVTMLSESNLQTAAKKKPKGRLKKISPLLWATVIVPTVCSLVYFSVMASDQYTSESSFVVRSARQQGTVSGLGALLQNTGFTRSQDDIYTVQEYMRSRTALDELKKQIPVRTYYEEKGDLFSRFNPFGLTGSDEEFYQYYLGKVNINLDAVSGISVLHVRSFDAAESKKINEALLKKGEELINRLNDRARKDTVSFAEKNVAVAEERVKETADNLMNYRTENGIFDLKEQSGVQMGLVSKLQDELIVIQTQLDQVRAVTPDNPQIPGLIAREKSLRKEISQQMRLISGKGDGSIAGKAAEYQRLFIENELAEKQLAATMASLEQAKSEADQQQLYLEVISKPSKPDVALYPKRFYNILATFVIGLILYGILSLLTASVREHKN